MVNNESRPLYNACSSGENEVVKYLLSKGANPKSPGCLTIALEFYHDEVFKTLFDGGAVDTSVSINENLTKVKFAVLRLKLSILKLQICQFN